MLMLSYFCGNSLGLSVRLCHRFDIQGWNCISACLPVFGWAGLLCASLSSRICFVFLLEVAFCILPTFARVCHSDITVRQISSWFLGFVEVENWSSEVLLWVVLVCSSG